jgi:hypothetical protein
MTEERKQAIELDRIKSFCELRNRQTYLRVQVHEWSKQFAAASKTLSEEPSSADQALDELPDRAEVLQIWAELKGNIAEKADIQRQINEMLGVNIT